MDLKDFIKETIGGIVEATLDLQESYEALDIIINPPVSVKERDLYEENGPAHTYRRVEIVDFDVAVTASSESAGGGKAGLRILAVEAGIDGTHTRANEEVSRVRFSIPITLSPSGAEAQNREALEARKQQARDANKRARNEAAARRMRNRINI